MPEGRVRFPSPPRAQAPHEDAPPKSYDTADLFGTASEVEIVHQQVVYRLKITRQGKLILNK